MNDKQLEDKAREIAHKFSCHHFQGLAIAVQMEQNEILRDGLEEIRHEIETNYGG
tara:strand:- start:1047 stop:1211 length:165 start_codon:yes stop_codon:yes gene_type:complete